MARKSMSQKLEETRTLITNSRDPEVEPHLTAFGIDATYLDEGDTLYSEAVNLMQQRETEHQEERAAYDEFYTQMDEVKETFGRTLDIVRTLSRRDPDLQNRLKIPTLSVDTIADWIDDGIGFYNRLLNEADFQIRLNRFGLTATELTAQRDAIDNLKTLRDQAAAEKGDTQEATRLRNLKLDELEDYRIELRALAKVALKDHPQLLEKLGILVRS